MQKHKRIQIAFCRIWQVALCCLPFAAFGQPQHFYRHLQRVNQNLTSQGSNHHLFRDSKGFVWIGTPDGLNRFDGHSIRQYLPDPSNNHSLSDGIIQGSFFEDENSDIWFCTYRAIHRYDRKTDSFRSQRIVRNASELIEDYRLVFLDTSNHVLWVQVGKQVFLVDIDVPDHPGTLLDEFDQLPMLHHSADTAGNHFLYCRIMRGLEVRQYKERERCKRIPLLPDSPNSPMVSSLVLDGPHDLWLGTDDGPLHFQVSSSPQPFPSQFGLSQKAIAGIADLDNGRLVVATKSDGIFIFDKTTKTLLGEVRFTLEGMPKSFPYTIETIYLDPTKTLWISCAGEGLFFTSLAAPKFDIALQKDQLPPTENNYVRGVAEDSQGRVWCLTKTGIAVLDKQGRILPVSARLRKPLLPNWKEPFYIRCDANDNVFVCTQNGLYVKKADALRFERVPVLGSGGDTGFTCLYQLTSGLVLVASTLNGVFELQRNRGQFVLKQHPQFIDSVGYTLIFEDSIGRVHFGRNLTSIVMYRESSGHFFYEKTIPFSPLLNTAHVGPDGRIWLATSSGLYSADGCGGPVEYMLEKSAPSRVSNSLEMDDSGSFWIGSNSHLIKYCPQDGTSRFYSLADGLQATEFNLSASARLRDGRLVFGGINGLNLFHPKDIVSDDTPPAIHFTSLVVNDTRLADNNPDAAKTYSFPFEDRTLSFSFVGIDYHAPGSVRYKYYLKGFESREVDGGTSGFARYARLPAGDYTLCVRAANHDGSWSDKFKELKFIIRPPWYATPWAIMLYVLAVGGGAYYWYQNRIHEIQKKAEMKSLEEEVKRKEAESRQLAAETETTILRLQMNPHFIFNSMNSINSLILKQDLMGASDYLGRFAQLMRTILELAAQPRISIADEIEFLGQYLKNEAMRFDRQFGYELELDDTIDPDDIMVPTMILQPFVENAILHGLLQKSGSGTIWVRFQLKGEQLYCSVEDNGVGRSAGQSKRHFSHRSKAMYLTARRLQLLEAETGVKSYFEFTDLFTPEGSPSGTRVDIYLPLL